MRLGSWNYKFQNAKIFRHYGPMAQEFYKAFGNDGIGKIGCDTLINSADIDGVMMIGIQALEKRSASLAAANNNLQMENAALQKKMTDMQDQLTKNNIQLVDKLTLLEKKLNEVMALNQKDNAEKNLVIEIKQ
jgi:regulator of replication initiation timing